MLISPLSTSVEAQNGSSTDFARSHRLPWKTLIIALLTPVIDLVGRQMVTAPAGAACTAACTGKARSLPPLSLIAWCERELATSLTLCEFRCAVRGQRRVSGTGGVGEGIWTGGVGEWYLGQVGWESGTGSPG